MPREAIDYSKTIIYKIVCKNISITDLYIGHTTNFINRKRNHKNTCSNEKLRNYNLKVYKTIRENGGWENWTMLEIEKFSCKDSNEASARERFWYEQFNSSLNMNSPFRTVEEISTYSKTFYDKNPNKKKEYNAKYYKKHAERIKQKQAIYDAEHSEEIKIYRMKNRKL